MDGYKKETPTSRRYRCGSRTTYYEKTTPQRYYKKNVKFATIRLCQGSVLNGCLNLGSGQRDMIMEGVELDLSTKRRYKFDSAMVQGIYTQNLVWFGIKKAKKNLHPKVKSVGELNIL